MYHNSGTNLRSSLLFLFVCTLFYFCLYVFFLHIVDELVMRKTDLKRIGFEDYAKKKDAEDGDDYDHDENDGMKNKETELIDGDRGKSDEKKK